MKLLNAFHIVLLMDNTYRINKYRLLLLEIVCVTSTRLTFLVAFMLLSNERENNFTWALEKVKGLFLTSDVHPQVIVMQLALFFQKLLTCYAGSTSIKMSKQNVKCH